MEDLINLVRGVKHLFNTFGDLMKVMAYSIHVCEKHIELIGNKIPSLLSSI